MMRNVQMMTTKMAAAAKDTVFIVLVIGLPILFAELHGDSCSSSRLAFDRQLNAMLIGDLLGNGKA